MNDLMGKGSFLNSPNEDLMNQQNKKKSHLIFKVILLSVFFIFLIVIRVCDFSSKEELFYKGIEKRDYAMLEQLIEEKNLDVNKRLENKSYLIFEAIISGDPQLVKLLLKKDADLTLRNRYGATPMQQAIFMGDNKDSIEIIELLQKNIPSLHSDGSIGIPPLYLASSENFPKIVKYLLDKGVDVDVIGIGTQGKTPLHIAAYYGYAEIVKLLVDNGASLNIRDEEGNTPLDLAYSDTVIRNRGDVTKIQMKSSEKTDIQKILQSHGAKKGTDNIAVINKIKPVLLNETPYPFEIKKMDINGNDVAYIDEGNGTPVVFIHGLSTTLSSFAPLFKDFIKQGYRVIALDLLGYGKSAKPEIQYNLNFHAQTVMQLVKKLGLSKIHLLGHSMGGAVSLILTIQNQDLIDSLMLLTPGGLDEYSEKAISFIKNNYDQTLGKRYENLLTAKNYFKSICYHWNKSMEKFFQARAQNMQDPEWKKVRSAIKYNTFSFIEQSAEILSQIHTIRVPVIALLGKYDMIISSREIKNHIFERTKGWQVITFDECGHMIQYEQREKTVKALLDFIKKNNRLEK